MQVPLLVVFGLDYTFWPYYVDTHLVSPFYKNSDGQVVDTLGEVVDYYEDVPQILETLKKRKIRIAVTSLSYDRKGTMELLEILGWTKLISFVEMAYPNKKEQIAMVCKYAGVFPNEVLFFDDSGANLNDVRKIGTLCIKVNTTVGMTMQLLESGLDQFNRSKLRPIPAHFHRRFLYRGTTPAITRYY